MDERPHGPAEVIRTEEEVRIETAWTAVEHVRVAKRIVSEEVQVTVTLRREELVVEHRPADGARVDAAAVPGAGTEPTVIVLSREEPVVETRVVPYERVAVATTRSTEQKAVTAARRVERIDVDSDEVGPMG